MYPRLVFLHVIGVFGFLMSHGVSAGVYFALRRERECRSDRLVAPDVERHGSRHGRLAAAAPHHGDHYRLRWGNGGATAGSGCR